MMNNKVDLDTNKNTSTVFVSIVIYVLLGQLVQTLPIKLVNGGLLSHTLASIFTLIALYYLISVYKPQKKIPIKLNILILYILLGVSICTFINFPYNILNSYHNKPHIVNIFINYSFVGRTCLLLSLSIIGPVIEEIYFRLYIYNLFKDQYNIAIGVIGSAFLYMFLHEFKIELLYLFLPGIVYALIYERTKTIWSSVVVHGLNNLIWFALVYYS